MNWKKAIGYGVGLWLVMFALISGMIAWGAYGTTWSHVLLAFSGYAVAVGVASYTPIPGWRVAAIYGFSWVIIALALDSLVTLRFNPDLFASFWLWFGYALVALAPFVCVDKGIVLGKRHPITT